MAEHSFQEVMRQYKRMCCGKACSDCDFYKFKTSLSHQMACLRFLKEYPVEAEALVMNWASEHPEPVYPTWKEWLEEQRVVVHFDSVDKHGKKVKWELTNKSNCPIPADMAQKLEVQPKEDA